MTYRFRLKDFRVNSIGENISMPKKDIFNLHKMLYQLDAKGIKYEYIWKSKDKEYMYIVTEHQGG